MSGTPALARPREYETIFLVRPEVTDDGVDRIKERVRGIVSREGGRVIRFTVWGKKKTMYPIAKQPRAVYVHAHYLGGTKLVAEVERNLRNLDEVTRYMSIRLADDVDPDTKPTLEDIRMMGDVEEVRPGLPEREGRATPEVPEESAPEEEEAGDEA